MANESIRRIEQRGWTYRGGVLIPESSVKTQASYDNHDCDDAEQLCNEHAFNTADEHLDAMSPEDTEQPNAEAIDLPEIGVVDQDDVEAFERRGFRLFADRDDRDRARAALSDFKRDDGLRSLARISVHWRDELNVLEGTFPNFHAVIELLRCAFNLAELRNHVPHLPPMLFNGPPGIGKTYVVDWMARALRVPLIRVSMETAQGNSNLCGSAAFWGNTKPGEVFNALVTGNIANPAILLDEVDKVGRDLRYDPLGPLYSLLDHRQATQFVDLSFPDIRLNASRIAWFLTSNDAELLPAPLLTRVRRFDIPTPTSAQCEALARNIFDGVRRDFLQGIDFDPVAEDVLSLLVNCPPRVMEQLLIEGVGRALYADRRFLMPGDIHLPPSKSGIGFI